MKKELPIQPGENQHWVPKFLIRNFADTDGRVFRLNIQTDEITKPPPKYAASSVDFNEFVIGGEPTSFEDYLERIETRAAPVLARIVRLRSLAGLDSEERGRVADFIAAQSFRTEAFYKGMDLWAARKQFGPTFAQLWKSAFLVSAEIIRRKWCLMVADADDVFYLGDNPVVLQRTENPSDGDGLGFGVQGVEAFLPLAPKCALYMPCPATSDEIVSGYETAVVLQRSGTANPDLLTVAQRVLRNTGPLYYSLAAGSPLNATKENVENLNYLQCAWASGAIFSNRSDFAFARRVFRESPNYRSVPRAWLSILWQRPQ